MFCILKVYFVVWSFLCQMVQSCSVVPLTWRSRGMHGRRGGARSDRYTSDDQNGHTASRIWMNISTLQYINQNWSFTFSLFPQECRKKHKEARRKLKSTQKSWGLWEWSLRDSFYSHWFEETHGLFLPHGDTLCIKLVVTNRDIKGEFSIIEESDLFCIPVNVQRYFMIILHLVWVSHKLPWKQWYKLVCGHLAASVNHSFRGPTCD